jgi:hypothetical protein
MVCSDYRKYILYVYGREVSRTLHISCHLYCMVEIDGQPGRAKGFFKGIINSSNH